MRTPLLSDDELDARLILIPKWERDGGAIARTYSFPSFLPAIRFVTELAAAAESLDHHPDIDIRYRKVTLTLSTHDSGGLTHLDMDLAAECDSIARRIHEPS